jgi:hypothetical protein
MSLVLPTFSGFAQPAGGGAFANTLSGSFDGTDDYMEIPQGAFDLGTGNWTFSFWFRPTGITSDSETIFMVKGTSGKYLAGFIQNGAFMLSDWNNTTLSYSTTLASNTWYHGAYIKNGSGSTDLHLYLDGTKVLEGYHPNTSNYGNDTATTRLGEVQSGLGYVFPFQGQIDEFGFWNSALTDTNITDIYNNGFPNDLGANGLNLSPVGYWRMGDGTGDTDSGGGAPASGDTIGTIVDQGSGGNNATGTNGPLYSNSVPQFSNKSGDFDGTDDMLTCSIPTSLMASDFTASIWVKLHPGATHNGDGAIFANNYSASGKVGWRLYFDSANGAGTGNLSVWASNGSGAYDNPIANVSVDLGNDTWTHLVWGRASGAQFVYRNGSAVSISQGSQGFDSSSSSYSDTSPAFKVFENSIGNGPNQGSCDEIAIWDSALTSANVTAIYNSGTPADLSSLSPEIWWRMGDGTGDTNSSGGSPENGGTIGTIVNQGSAGSSDATGTNGPTFSTNTP